MLAPSEQSRRAPDVTVGFGLAPTSAEPVGHSLLLTVREDCCETQPPDQVWLLSDIRKVRIFECCTGLPTGKLTGSPLIIVDVRDKLLVFLTRRDVEPTNKVLGGISPESRLMAWSAPNAPLVGRRAELAQLSSVIETCKLQTLIRIAAGNEPLAGEVSRLKTPILTSR
jgi:hypothetical protein